MVKSKVLILFIILLYFSCSSKEVRQTISVEAQNNFISAVDISSFPKIKLNNPIFKNSDGNEMPFLEILQSKGINTIRLRLWVNPIDEHSSFDEVKMFADILKSMGFKIYLTLHYSDTWADPGQQITPQNWQNIPYTALKDSVYNYTKMVVQQINPDLIQIGNEINNGLLHPKGNRFTSPLQFIELINEGISAVRDYSDHAQVMLHYAGYQGAEEFFDVVKGIDYDIIGLSYYPIWHGKSLIALEQNLIELRTLYKKDIMIAETAYPFTLGWNDWTNNIVGLEEQLILPEYPATPQGQKQFVQELKTIISTLDGGIGLAYWGADLIAWNGPESAQGSSWENQALFDFNNQVLPALDEFENP